MGLFRKKSKSTLSLVSVSSADKGGKNDVPKGRRRRSNSAQEQSVLQTKPSHSVREIKPATRYSEESAVSINSTTGSTASSKRPKLRLRKSISALVQGIPRPRQSTAKSDQVTSQNCIDLMELGISGSSSVNACKVVLDRSVSYDSSNRESSVFI